MNSRYRGLVAAPFTPFNSDFSLNVAAIPAYARLLRANGVGAAFVCGTTGEGLSMTAKERRLVAEGWMREADDRLRVIVHVGSTVLAEAQDLTRHAAEIGASAVAALAPCFFKPRNNEEVVDWCEAIVKVAPEVPFYYYNIPSMTGVNLKIAPFLALAEKRLPSLVGIKYTHEDLPDYEECVRYGGGKYDILFGRDELLLEGWQHQALGAVGSTYNYAAPLYLRLLEKLVAGNLAEARALQDQAIKMIALCNGAGVTHLAASKALMAELGVDCGPPRLPLKAIGREAMVQLKRQLDGIGFFATACKAA